MNGQRDQTSSSSSSCCNIHPKEILVGVCPLCLNERLLRLLALRRQRKHVPLTPPSSSKSDLINNSNANINNPQNFQKSYSFINKKHKTFFPFTSSFLSFLELQHRKPHLPNHDSLLSPDDSFISIKFEDNGATSWEKGRVPTISLERCKGSSLDHIDAMEETKKDIIIPHLNKSRAPQSWRRRIGQLLHIIRLRRPSGCHVSSKVEGVDATKKKFPN